MQTTHQLIFCLCQCRFYTRQSIAVEQFKLHASFFQNLDIALHRIQLRIFTENLQSAFRAVFIRDANITTQITQTVTAVFSHTHHPFFIDCIMLGITVFQHLCHPLQLPQARSEEHTSELQSRENLVCRLLLEKKKQLTSS